MLRDEKEVNSKQKPYSKSLTCSSKGFSRIKIDLIFEFRGIQDRIKAWLQE